MSTKIKTNKKSERELVNILIKKIHTFSKVPLNIVVDRDSPHRVFKSGYDFYITFGGKVVFFEAKKTRNNARTFSKNPLNLLTEFQKLMCMKTVLNRTPYFIVEFHESLEGVLCRLYATLILPQKTKAIKKEKEQIEDLESFLLFQGTIEETAIEIAKL